MHVYKVEEHGVEAEGDGFLATIMLALGSQGGLRCSLEWLAPQG